MKQEIICDLGVDKLSGLYGVWCIVGSRRAPRIKAKPQVKQQNSNNIMTTTFGTSKPIVEQRDRFNQRLTLHIESANGESANLQAYIRGLLKTQSLEKWNGSADELKAWLAESVAGYIRNLEVRIYER